MTAEIKFKPRLGLKKARTYFQISKNSWAGLSEKAERRMAKDQAATV